VLPRLVLNSWAQVVFLNSWDYSCEPPYPVKIVSFKNFINQSGPSSLRGFCNLVRENTLPRQGRWGRWRVHLLRVL
jgi:hypothetical protein